MLEINKLVFFFYLFMKIMLAEGFDTIYYIIYIYYIFVIIVLFYVVCCRLLFVLYLKFHFLFYFKGARYVTESASERKKKKLLISVAEQNCTPCIFCLAFGGLGLLTNYLIVSTQQVQMGVLI